MERIVLLSTCISLFWWGTKQCLAQDSGAATAVVNVVAEQQQDWVDDRWSRVNTGPLMSSSIITSHGTVLKGIAIKIGDNQEATACYDTDLLNFSAAWTGGFLEYTPQSFGLAGAAKPKGTIMFDNPILPGWAHNGTFKDPRTKGIAPLPDQWGKYQGLYMHGNRVVLSYKVNSTEILESPWCEVWGDSIVLTRTFEIGPLNNRLTGLLCSIRNAEASIEKVNGKNLARLRTGSDTLWVATLGQAIELTVENGRVMMNIEPNASTRMAKVLISKSPLGRQYELSSFSKLGKKLKSFDSMTKGGLRLWSPLVTRGFLGKSRNSFAIDTIKLPFNNPWNALLFTAGHDFFSDGRAAICTVHGDVWLVEGIDDKLEKITWRRFATGLFQPLGLKIRNDQLFVLGRDQITCLHDLNNNGEADFYENFNNDCEVAGEWHAFATCLENDSKGNFYYLKCAENTRHGGTLLRLSADGSNLDVFATGFRNPNGLGIGPDDVITVGDQQGEWVPETRLDIIQQGGFYGFMPMHHREVTPSTYNPPFCFIPRHFDNSAGGQVWVPKNIWGPLGGRMIHLSYGRCTPMLILADEMHPEIQGAMQPLPGRFLSGAMRGRFNPKDGHLYITGLRGPSTAAVHDGCFQRFRYTGGAFHKVIRYATQPGQLKIILGVTLDRELAEDKESYSLKQWNYRWTKNYGSKDWSLENPNSEGRTTLDIQHARLAADKKTVHLQIPNLQQAMQFEFKYDLDSAAGKVVRGVLAGTINKL